MRQGAQPVNVFYFGRQRLQTRNYIVMTEQDEALDLMALAEEASLGMIPNVPEPTLTDQSEPWVEAETAGVPERSAPPKPWAPRTPPEVPAQPAPTPDPGHTREPEPARP